MLLERKITSELINWKKSPKKPCLLIKGARQVGKTYIVDKFAKSHYENYLHINFETQPSFKAIFDGDLDIATLKMNLEIYFPDQKLVPKKTLLFLDEIQSCPKARVALKTFALDGSIDVIASGSLLGLRHKEVSSFPVGYVKTLELLPLDFEEFLWGLGITKDTINILRASFLEKKALSQGMTQKMEEYFRQYMIIGGMPEVVKIFLETHSPQSARAKQRDLLKDYEDDISNYAPKTDKLKIVKTFNSIPMQLAKKNKKFMFSEIDAEEKNTGDRKYSSSILWLQNAGIINFCHNLTQPALPLTTNQIVNIFKIYMRDTGLLVAMLEQEVQKAIWEKDYGINEGGIVENLIAEEIYSRHELITYFEKKGKSEIDFVVNINGKIAAVEIKSGKHSSSRSLDSIAEQYSSVKRRLLFEPESPILLDDKNIEHYPLFMSMFL